MAIENWFYNDWFFASEFFSLPLWQKLQFLYIRILFSFLGFFGIQYVLQFNRFQTETRILAVMYYYDWIESKRIIIHFFFCSLSFIYDQLTLAFLAYIIFPFCARQAIAVFFRKHQFLCRKRKGKTEMTKQIINNHG